MRIDACLSVQPANLTLALFVQGECKPDECEKCHLLRLFERYEIESCASYLGSISLSLSPHPLPFSPHPVALLYPAHTDVSHHQPTGIMGLEDKLQPLVPETIEDCLRAGIKVRCTVGTMLGFYT